MMSVSPSDVIVGCDVFCFAIHFLPSTYPILCRALVVLNDAPMLSMVSMCIVSEGLSVLNDAHVKSFRGVSVGLWLNDAPSC